MLPLNDRFQIPLSYQQLTQNLQQLLGREKNDVIPNKRLCSELVDGGLTGGSAANQESWEDKDRKGVLKSQQSPTYLSPSGWHVRDPGRPPVLCLSIVCVWSGKVCSGPAHLYSGSEHQMTDPEWEGLQVQVTPRECPHTHTHTCVQNNQRKVNVCLHFLYHGYRPARLG